MRRLCPRLSAWDVAGTVSSADVWSWAFNLDAAWCTWCWLMLLSWMFPLGTEGWAPSWCRGRQHSIRCPKNLIVWHFFFWVILMISDSLGVWPFSEFSIWHRKRCETHLALRGPLGCWHLDGPFSSCWLPWPTAGRARKIVSGKVEVAKESSKAKSLGYLKIIYIYIMYHIYIDRYRYYILYMHTHIYANKLHQPTQVQGFGKSGFILHLRFHGSIPHSHDPMAQVFNWPMVSPPFAKLSARIFALLPLQVGALIDIIDPLNWCDDPHFWGP